jgi:hypothetical protein
MAKVIVFSGHGSWQLGKDTFTTLPAKCSIKFYTCNMKTLSDGLGGDIDRGIITGLDPDQEAGPFKSVPNMRLFPPTGLNIRAPDATNWHVIKLPCAVPADNKNLQVQIASTHGGGGSLETLLSLLEPAIATADEVILLWAACRAINLKRTAAGATLGINKLQR